jgi:hypothetical protein
MADSFDLDAMITRFKNRADAVRNRQIPPVEGEARRDFVKQAQLDFQDFAMIADADVSFDDGVVTLSIDLRPPDSPE